MPDFREATDLLCLSAEELAQLFNVSVASIRQARMSPKATGYRTPPDGWEAKLARIARERGKELEALARALEGK